MIDVYLANGISVLTTNGKKQKMIAKKADITVENLIMAILFFAIFVLVMIFAYKVYRQVKPVPPWSKSLTSVEKAINTLDPGNSEVTRTANVQLKKYSIKGFNKSYGMCPEDEKPHCICACDSVNCDNAREDKEKYCRNVFIPPQKNFVITQDDEKPATYRLGLEKVDDQIQVKVVEIIR